MPARPTQARPTQATAKGHSAAWLYGLLSGVVIMLAAPVALLVAVLALPTLLVWLADQGASRATARTLGPATAAACVAPLVALWRTGHDWNACFALLADPARIAAAWAIIGGFWLLGELLPLAARLWLDTAAARRAARLRARRAACAQEWGLEAPADDPT